ncbi:PAS domain S-box protein [Halomicrobium urmianum]|uniref:PAS domain S-box protein n=1 Tax=Halomicrobium urmianum TaxID=1586233 RepID=UPI001CDA0B5E|nr:bacterio-opsin activator domain-containing protein [Halomicrobium urmianum]
MTEDRSRPLVEGTEALASEECAVHEELAERVDLAPLVGVLLDAVSECLLVIDDQGRIAFANPAVDRVFRYEPDELIGERLAELIPQRLRADFLDGFQRYLRTGEQTFEWTEVEFPGLARNGIEVPLSVSVREFAVDDRQYFVGVMRDVTDRVERENELSTERAFVDSVFDALPDVVYAFDREGQFLRWNDRLTAVTGYSDAEVASMHSLDFVAADDRDEVVSSLIEVFETGGIATAEGDLVTKGGERIPFEFTGAPLTDDDGEVVGLTGVSRDVTERRRRERRLERLNALNAVIRSVDEALIEATTRSEMEQAICERLAAADTYVGAAVGGFDTDREALEVWAADGVDVEGFRTLLPGGDRPLADSPAARALDERAVQVIDPTESGEPAWHRDADRQGYDRLVAVPVVTDERTFGVLGVYARRGEGVPEREREILEEMGRVVGDALQNAVTRELLHADAVTELELGTTDSGLTFVSLSGRADCRIELDRVLTFGDDFVFYVTVTGAPVERFREAAGTEPGVESVEHLGTNADRHRFKLNVGSGTMTSALAEYGARTTAATADEGDGRLVAHLSPDVDVRELVDALTETYPETELKARRETSRTLRTPMAVRQELSADLTEKQRAALQAAYFSGYFEWPSRSNTAAEIADVLDIAPQTFHQHLRIAEQKVFRTLFGDGPSNEAA